MRFDDIPTFKVRGGQLKRLGDVLPGATERMGLRGLMTEARVRQAWAKAVGGRVAENSWVNRLRGSTLEVRVSGDVWATELRYLSDVIREKVNAELGRDVVREIVIQRSRGRRT